MSDDTNLDFKKEPLEDKFTKNSVQSLDGGENFNINRIDRFYKLFNRNKYKNYFQDLHINFDPKHKLEKIWIYFQDIFKKYENEFIIQPIDIILLKFCNISYSLPKDRPIEYLEYILENEETTNNDMFAIYINQNLQSIIICYKWTDIKNINDIISDLETVLWVNAIDNRLFSELYAYDHIKTKYPDYKIYICWHSLGGTMAYIIMKHRNADRCTVFNPGSVPNKLFLEMAQDTLINHPWVQNIYTYRVLWDPVSTFSYVGNTKIFRVSQVDPLRLHSIQIFLDNC